MRVAQQGEAGEEAQVSVGRGARGRAKQLKEAEEDLGGKEQWGGGTGRGTGGRPEGHYR